MATPRGAVTEASLLRRSRPAGVGALVFLLVAKCRICSRQFVPGVMGQLACARCPRAAYTISDARRAASRRNVQAAIAARRCLPPMTAEQAKLYRKLRRLMPRDAALAEVMR